LVRKKLNVKTYSFFQAIGIPSLGQSGGHPAARIWHGQVSTNCIRFGDDPLEPVATLMIVAVDLLQHLFCNLAADDCLTLASTTFSAFGSAKV